MLSNERSVRSGKTLDEIAIDKNQRPLHQIDITRLDISGAQKAPPPPGPVKPMLAQLVKEAFDRPGWLFEIKWDGYRAIAQIHRGSVQFYSRHGISYVKDYPEIIEDLETIGFEVILDGELVVTDTLGRADFSLIQKYRHTGRGNLLYYVFDLLYLEGYDLRRLPLTKRKTLLKEVLPSLPHIRYSGHIEKSGKDFFRLAQEQNLEGVMAKEGNSMYLSGVRTRHWQKIKTYYSQEFVIGGFTEPRGGRTGIGALLVGYYDDNNLIFAGNVGGGFTSDELPGIRKKLESHARNITPFKNPPKPYTGATWVDPTMVCEVKFAEWTADSLLRQPVFLGFRYDIDPFKVQKENPVSPPEGAVNFTKPESPDQYIQVSGRRLKLTNLNKVYWPDEGISKGDTIDYYRQIAPFILPHLRDRPESLHRFPDGIKGKEFFHKDLVDAPEWAQTERIESDTQNGITRYFLCQDEASLVYMVNLGALEINPWISRVGSLDYPDYMVIDLDPLDCTFDDVVDTAIVVHQILEKTGMPHFPKTSGATGIHIFVPLGAIYTYAQARQFSALICSLVNSRLPLITSLERLPQKRKGRVYLDFLQNTKGKTMACAYSLRPRPGAPVSAPLKWEEVRRGLHPSQFTTNVIRDRLERYGDLWEPLLGKGIDMKKYLNILAYIYDFLPENNTNE